MKTREKVVVVLITIAIFVLFLYKQAKTQSLDLQLTYTSAGQAGAGLGFSTKNGYGAMITGYEDVTWIYTSNDTFSTQKFCVGSISKSIHEMVRVNIGVGMLESCRHVGNNEWDSKNRSAVYTMGVSIRPRRVLALNFGIVAGKEILQIYSGLGLIINM